MQCRMKTSALVKKNIFACHEGGKDDDDLHMIPDDEFDEDYRLGSIGIGECNRDLVEAKRAEEFKTCRINLKCTLCRSPIWILVTSVTTTDFRIYKCLSHQTIEVFDLCTMNYILYL